MALSFLFMSIVKLSADKLKYVLSKGSILRKNMSTLQHSHLYNMLLNVAFVVTICLIMFLIFISTTQLDAQEEEYFFNWSDEMIRSKKLINPLAINVTIFEGQIRPPSSRNAMADFSYGVSCFSTLLKSRTFPVSIYFSMGTKIFGLSNNFSNRIQLYAALCHV